MREDLAREKGRFGGVSERESGWVVGWKGGGGRRSVVDQCYSMVWSPMDEGV